MSYGLGRRHAPDQRDHGFLLREVVPAPTREIQYRYWFQNGWWGDQADTPQCVGYAWAHFLEDGPLTQLGPGPILAPSVIYDEAKKVDEWPGEAYDGTSVRAGAKALQARGFISEYRWAFDLGTVVNALLTTGPVVMGTNWYAGMFAPDADGVIHLTGDLAGGHAYELTGVSRALGRVRLKQSWGRAWGINGHAWLTFEDLERLVHEDGEACLATETRAPATQTA
jgi:hypothetical protein